MSNFTNYILYNLYTIKYLHFAENKWNMWIPGMGCDEVRPYKKLISTEAHKQVKICKGLPHSNNTSILINELFI